MRRTPADAGSTAAATFGLAGATSSWSRGSRPSRVAALTALAAALLSGCVTRVDRVSTRAERITDPDYTGVYRVMGERELADRRYSEAWSEFAAMGDYPGLRKVLFAYADDAELFDERLYASMVVEYGRAFALQHNADDPLDHLDERVAAASDRHLAAGTVARARIAWAIRFHYHKNVRPFPSRVKHYPQLLALRDRFAESEDPQIRAYAQDVNAALDALQKDAAGRL